MPDLGVNIDHVATVRQARKTNEPDPVWAAAAAELGGADCITVHLREDRRHIQDRDVRILRETVTVKLNLEMACEEEIVDIACDLVPQQVTLVPEKREEVTTEGGLDIVTNRRRVGDVIARLKDKGIIVNLFLDPDQAQIAAAAEILADGVELHTGQYALVSGEDQFGELLTLEMASEQILQFGLALHAGHGLTYRNVQPIAAIEGMQDLNIGHSIVSRSILTGLQQAVREMKALIA